MFTINLIKNTVKESNIMKSNLFILIYLKYFPVVAKLDFQDH